MIFLTTAALVVVFILLIYGSSLYGEPVMDDMTAIFGNKSIIEGKWREQLHNVRWSSRALTRMSWALTACGPGRKLPHFIAGLHLGNMLLHAVAALLTWPIAVAVGANPVVVALVFAVHPFASSAVANMSHRASILAHVFVLVAIDAALVFHWILVVPFLALAVLAKEDALGPLSLCAAWTELGRRKLAVVDDGQLAAGFGGSLPWGTHISTAMVETLRRWPLWMIGLGQSVDHNPTRRHYVSLEFVAALLSAAAVLATFGALGRPVDGAALALIAVSPLPLYWFIRVRDTVVEGRYYATVLPMALWLAAIPAPNQLPNQLPFTAIGIAILAALAARRSFVYQDQIQFWRSAVRQTNPQERSMMNLGVALASHGDPVGAISWYERVLAQNPNQPITLMNLGLILEDEANRYYARSCGQLEKTGQRGEDYRQFLYYRKMAYERIHRAFELAPLDAIVQGQHERISKDTRGWKREKGKKPRRVFAEDGNAKPKPAVIH